MRKINKAASLVLALLLVGPALSPALADGAAGIWPVIKGEVEKDPRIEATIDALVGRMSVAEKVGQVIQAEIHSISPREVREFGIGSVLSGGGSYPGKDRHAPLSSWVALADAYYDASVDKTGGRAGIPILWGIDAVHGHNNVFGATIFPHNIALGAARDPDLVRKIGAATARAVRASGINWVFAPTLAVARDDRWGRTYESYSEDPAIVARLAPAMIEGLQGSVRGGSFLAADRVIATAKHFIGDGGTLGGDDQGDTRISERQLRAIHGAGYLPAIRVGVQTIMASFNSWNGNKLHGNRYLLTEVLKNRLGFDGFVVSDWNGHSQLPGCSKESCAKAINAGVDMIMVPLDWRAFYQATLDQVTRGIIPMTRLEDAVRRILRVKLRAGLFDGVRPSDQPLAGRKDILGAKAHRALARRAVRQSLVLLKNEGAVLPIRPGARVLVAGKGADNIPMQAGGWTLTWQGRETTNQDFPGATSLWAGIRDAITAAGGKAQLSPGGDYAIKPDVAVVIFGEAPYAEMDGDLADGVAFQDGGEALRLLERLRKDGIATIGVLLSGRPLWVGPQMDAADAFIAAWLPGSEGAGLADLIIADQTGAPRHDFTGRLAFSWPRRADQTPLNIGTPGYDPLFPVGYGLSYGAAPSDGR
jgi:beta-glucosidase